MARNNWTRFYVMVVCLLIISGCEMFGSPDQLDIVTFTPAPSDTPAMTGDATATPMCYFSWAYNTVPSEQLEPFRQLLSTAGYADFELSASSYGEDHVCQSDGKTVSSNFLLMDITPKMTLTVDSLDDTSALGAHVRQIITAIKAEDTTGLKIARIEITFSDGADTILWSASTFDYTTAISDDELFAFGT